MRQSTLGIGQLERGTSDNHGHADWMTMQRAQTLFPPVPHPVWGGRVVGEAALPKAGIRYSPKDPNTWGEGGKAPLLIDQCDGDGPVHSIEMAGTGMNKTVSLVTTLLTWKQSRVVLDPSTELGPMLADALAEDGQNVIQLGIGSNGFNVLKSIDINHPIAETRVNSIVGRIVGPVAPSGGAKEGDSHWKQWGKCLITALLAHMMWSESLPDELKTLDTLREGLCIPDDEMMDVLRGIHATSPSRLARHQAATVLAVAKAPETFAGIFGSATRDTGWLSTEAYAYLVSGDAFNAADICRGKTSVFVQLPLEALNETPAIARVIIGSLIDAVIAADGDVDGKILFALDEAVLLGPMTSLLTARDQARKYGVVIHALYQSEGQVKEVWGEAGRDAWFDSCAWRSYAGVKNTNTAKDLSTSLGTMPVRAYSKGHNKGRSGRMLEVANRSQGSNENEHEISRELAKPSEILTDFRTDERIVIVSGNEMPLRCGTAIGFRRQEIAMRLTDNRFVSSGVTKNV